MKKLYTVVFLLLAFISCTSVEKSDLEYLNGYWEIEKVTQPDGKEIDFSMNTIYDYYKIDEQSKGIYKKVTPQLDGTFIVDNYQEEIEIIENKDNFIIQFYSEFSDREVTIKELSANKLVLKNQENKTYYYKRAEPINLLDNEQ